MELGLGASIYYSSYRFEESNDIASGTITACVDCNSNGDLATSMRKSTNVNSKVFLLTYQLKFIILRCYSLVLAAFATTLISGSAIAKQSVQTGKQIPAQNFVPTAVSHLYPVPERAKKIFWGTFSPLNQNAARSAIRISRADRVGAPLSILGVNWLSAHSKRCRRTSMNAQKNGKRVEEALNYRSISKKFRRSLSR